ncbi:hypothetical protein CTAYLR_005532 [Chrysophaeum taylorii]|uniref:MAM domain-containing protein n=1 Tax=Chrysophaeum taylorii TaxID=2483200 RepID=A0AAD7U4I3_9STRA|nr:hypothetical protein CTAYLR_005532 [Chrysophaeum taylorii]
MRLGVAVLASAQRGLADVGCFDIAMFDTWGDGWNGAEYQFTSRDGAVVASGGIEEFVSSQTDTICVDDAPVCLTISVDSGSYPSEIYWNLGEGVLSGGAPDVGQDLYVLPGDDGVVDSSCTNPPFSVVSCDFEEENSCGWTTEEESSHRWTRSAGATSSPDTGPSTSWGHYAYVEASYPYHPHKGPFLLTSPPFVVDESFARTYLEFYFHMYGSDMGNLTLEYLSDDDVRWVPQGWNKTGDQGDIWHSSGSLEIPAKVRGIRFVAFTGSGYRSDMLVDNVTFAPVLKSYRGIVFM